MSAWLVSKAHIDAMLVAGLHPGQTWSGNLRWFVKPDEGQQFDYERDKRELTLANANEVGRMLWTENVASLCARYGDNAYQQEYERVLEYEFKNRSYTPTPQETFKIVSCYEYQTCEHAGWENSEARCFCTSLTEANVGKLSDGPWGWEEATWQQKGAKGLRPLGGGVVMVVED